PYIYTPSLHDALPILKTFLQQLLNNTYTGTKFIITTRYDFDPLEGRLPESIEHISLPELHFPQTNWLMNKYTELANLDIRKKKQDRKSTRLNSSHVKI